MKNILLLHIGMHKTGTTAIQNFLGTHSETMEQYGWYYPDFKNIFPDIEAHQGGVHKNGDFLYVERGKVDVDSKNWTSAWEVILKKLKHKNVLLSAEELFEWESKYIIQNIKERYQNVKLLIYLRRQDEYIESRWNQLVKNPRICLDSTFEEFISNLSEEHSTIYQNLHYWGRLEQLAQVVGKENIIVRVYEKEQFAGERKSIISDFLNAIGISDDLQKDEEEKYLNLRLNENVLEAKRAFNTILKHKSEEVKRYYSNLFSELSNLMPMDKKESMNYFEPLERERFYKQFEKDNEMVAKEYLHRSDGRLFYSDNKSAPKKMRNLQEMNEVVLQIIAHIMIEQTEEMNAHILKVETQNRIMMRLMQKDNRSLVYFAAGANCREFLKNYSIIPEFILDNDVSKNGKMIDGIRICTPQEIEDWSKCFIVVTSTQTIDIENQLASYGLRKEKDYILLRELL